MMGQVFRRASPDGRSGRDATVRPEHPAEVIEDNHA